MINNFSKLILVGIMRIIKEAWVIPDLSKIIKEWKETISSRFLLLRNPIITD